MTWELPWMRVIRQRRTREADRIRQADWLAQAEREQAHREAQRMERHYAEGEARCRQESEPMSKDQSDAPFRKASSCAACGHPEEARPTTAGGVTMAVELCPSCTQRLAGKALRKITRRFLSEQIE